jgi:hypothetical protein
VFACNISMVFQASKKPSSIAKSNALTVPETLSWMH